MLSGCIGTLATVVAYLYQRSEKNIESIRGRLEKEVDVLREQIKECEDDREKLWIQVADLKAVNRDRVIPKLT